MIIKLQHARPTDHYQPEGFYFEIQAEGNHETLATSEIYNSKRAAMDAIMSIVAPGAVWSINDLTA